MNAFLEERLPGDALIGALYADEYNVEITQTSSGQEYRRIVHPFPARHFSVTYRLEQADLWTRVLGLYHRSYGMFSGFRVSTIDDFSTNGNTGTPTATDQPLALVSAGVYQLQKQYGSGSTPLPIGLPVRTIFKPVTGTVVVGISGVALGSGWTADTTTGLVTFAANKTANITGITQAASAIATIGAHAFVVGDSAYFSNVVGMSQINTLRGLVTGVSSTTITVQIDSTLFGAYASGGAVNSRPQIGEPVTAGCQFDIPCRFNSRIDVNYLAPNIRDTSTIDIMELLAL
ncbi:DUF2460 domain-containing protein [Glaciimonas sp. PCH181]|uniref:DUF2460 domain-containing protein n=1 Tax=Glaciimonas sp. PCH181 TaxID=2133943 RepID=UPI000D3D88A2|nr:DUF2460 domain-containing protein [Glaciimonas sp. PCH181]PUA17258.1 hypothetical protein C7W93_15105 [Glaciimonas sp. PCH181]